MPISREEADKVKCKVKKLITAPINMLRRVKYSKIQNWNTADVNIQIKRRQSKIYRTKTLHISIKRDQEAKV